MCKHLPEKPTVYEANDNRIKKKTNCESFFLPRLVAVNLYRWCGAKQCSKQRNCMHARGEATATSGGRGRTFVPSNHLFLPFVGAKWMRFLCLALFRFELLLCECVCVCSHLCAMTDWNLLITYFGHEKKMKQERQWERRKRNCDASRLPFATASSLNNWLVSVVCACVCVCVCLRWTVLAVVSSTTNKLLRVLNSRPCCDCPNLSTQKAIGCYISRYALGFE